MFCFIFKQSKLKSTQKASTLELSYKLSKKLRRKGNWCAGANLDHKKHLTESPTSLTQYFVWWHWNYSCKGENEGVYISHIQVISCNSIRNRIRSHHLKIIQTAKKISLGIYLTIIVYRKRRIT